MNAKTAGDAIEVLREGYAAKFDRREGISGWLRGWISALLPPPIRPEIQQDWIIVSGFADRAAAVVAAKQRDGARKPEEDPDVRTVARALACLDAAERARDFAQAWLYVNTADALLPLVAPEDDLETMASRLGAWDIHLAAGPKAVLDRSGALERANGLTKRKSSWSSTPPVAATPPGAPSTPVPPAPPAGDPAPPAGANPQNPANPVDPPNPAGPAPIVCDSKAKKPGDLRAALQELQQVRSQCWNEANRVVAFTGDLWRWAGIGVFSALVLALAISEAWVAVTPGFEYLRLRLLSAAVLGFFGGALSAFIQARETVIAIPRYQLLVMHTLLRMLIGAAGSFVIMLSVLALPLGQLSTMVTTNVFAFLLVGIAAGFSERLFITTLEKAALNLSTVSGTGAEESTTGVKAMSASD